MEEHRNHLISKLVHWLMTRHVPPTTEGGEGARRVTAGRAGRRIMDIGKGNGWRGGEFLARVVNIVLNSPQGIFPRQISN